MSNVYTAGTRIDSVTTRKYNSSGTQQWAADHGAKAGGGTTIVLGIAADAAGNVYTAGQLSVDGYTTRKYDPDGNLVWSVNHGHSSAAAYCIAVDPDGNVYTGGNPFFTDPTDFGSPVCTTRKYDASGNLLWSVHHGETVYGIATDAAGNVYTGGEPDDGGVTTRKYDTDGNLVWTASHGIRVWAIAVDAAGNVYTTGTRAYESDGMTTRKYDASGNLVWSVEYGNNAPFTTRTFCIAVDLAGNVVVGGERIGGVTTRMYNSSGTLLWSTDHGEWPTPPVGAVAGIRGVAFDAEDHVLTAGSPSASGTTRAYDKSGNLVWSVDHGALVAGVASEPLAAAPRGAPVGLPGGGGWGGTLPDWPIDFIDRDGSTPLGYYKLMDIRPTLLTWDAIGGCDRATFRVVSGELDLWQLPNLLRCGVHVGDGRGGHVWWGYVHSVDLDLGSYSFGVSLDNLANRIAVAYEYVGDGVNASGTRATTDWAEEEDSMAEFGTFERLESLSSADEYDAEARRDALLEVLAWPQPTIDFGDGKLSATIQAYGWHHILKRRYYNNADAVGTMTTDQMADLLGEVGEFFTEIDIGVESGIYSNEYRDGDTNAWEEFKALLESGWTQTDYYAEPEANVRLLCYVTPDRVLRVFREPYPGVTDLRLYPSGIIENQYGGALQPGPWLVGKWARLVNIVPPQISLQPVVNPTRVFIERVEYDVERMRLRPQPRGLSAYQVGGIEPG